MPVDFDDLVLAPLIGVFGESALYAPARGAPVTLTGIFDEAARTLTFEEGAAVSSTRQLLGVRLADFPVGVTPAQGDRVTLRGAVYQVADVEPDGMGFAKLVLLAAA